MLKVSCNSIFAFKNIKGRYRKKRTFLLNKQPKTVITIGNYIELIKNKNSSVINSSTYK